MSTNKKSGNSLMILALALVLGFGAVYVTLGPRDNASSPPQPSETTVASGEPGKTQPNSGHMAAFVTKKSPEALPDIAFTDGDGKAVKLSDFKGRTVLLNLWATWCAPCREEMPALNRLQHELGSDAFEVVALSLDRQGLAASKKFLDEVKATALKLYVDATGSQGSVLKLVGMPTTILIDKDGLEIGRLAGPAEWDSADAKALIAAAMK
jgi:thiol-disulfide isomerase/thioredoxin